MAHSITIGNFDGVHLGHRVLIERVLELAAEKNATQAAVLTFEPHPREFLGIRPIPERLCSFEEKKRRIQSLGIKNVFVQPFDAAFSNLSAEDFLKWLSDSFHPQHIVVGNNFYFGKNRGGTPAVLQEWGKKNHIHVEIIVPLQKHSIIVSSTEIRIHVQSGNMKAASEICGFDFSLPMELTSGDSRGRQLGFPTLNSSPPLLTAPAKYCLPPHGVYITRVRIGSKTLPAITNFGIRPTFHNAGDGEFFESHILKDWDDCLSSKHFTVDFIDRIRAEQRFTDKNDLIQRIQQDIIIAKQFHKL